MGELTLWFFKCKECKKGFPIVQWYYGSKAYAIESPRQVKKEVKYCPYCGSRKIQLVDEHGQYFG